MTDIPAKADQIDPIALKTRKLIEDAARATATHDGDLAEFARQTLIGREQRNRYFDPVMFSNPSWDILLNLYVAAADGQGLSVLDCCAALAVPQGVTLRLLTLLKDDGTLIETPDVLHPRRTLISLSEQTRVAMSAYLASLICLGLGPEAFVPDSLSIRS